MSRTQASTGCFQGWLGDGMFLISDRGLSPISLAIRTASAESLHRFFASAQSVSLVVIPIWMPRLSVVPEASEPTRGSEVGEQDSPASVCLPLRGDGRLREFFAVILWLSRPYSASSSYAQNSSIKVRIGSSIGCSAAGIRGGSCRLVLGEA